MPQDLWAGAILDGRVYHGRAGDVARAFRYRATYLSLPLAEVDAGRGPLPVDRPGLWSLRRRDHGARDGGPLAPFLRGLLREAGFNEGLAGGAELALVTLPRSIGYGFNPVSFWLARDGGGQLRAVLAEVANTFGEHHLYLCRKADHGAIGASDRLGAEKLFHVSPFLPRAGRYTFRFDTGPGRFGAWIDWTGNDDRLRLTTALTATARPLTREALRRAAWAAPFAAQRVTALIHLQALRMKVAGLVYRPKPPQTKVRVSAATDGGKDV